MGASVAPDALALCVARWASWITRPSPRLSLLTSLRERVPKSTMIGCVVTPFIPVSPVFVIFEEPLSSDSRLTRLPFGSGCLPPCRTLAPRNFSVSRTGVKDPPSGSAGLGGPASFGSSGPGPVGEGGSSFFGIKFAFPFHRSRNLAVDRA
jgi:hypothetical protein